MGPNGRPGESAWWLRAWSGGWARPGGGRTRAAKQKKRAVGTPGLLFFWPLPPDGGRPRARRVLGGPALARPPHPPPDLDRVVDHLVRAVWGPPARPGGRAGGGRVGARGEKGAAFSRAPPLPEARAVCVCSRAPPPQAAGLPPLCPPHPAQDLDRSPDNALTAVGRATGAAPGGGGVGKQTGGGGESPPSLARSLAPCVFFSLSPRLAFFSPRPPPPLTPPPSFTPPHTLHTHTHTHTHSPPAGPPPRPHPAA